jgi:hypothetical protein
LKKTAVKPMSGAAIENLAEKFRETFGLEVDRK